MVDRQRVAIVRGLSFVGVALTALVMLVGAWTRLSDAGLGCPDWPGCYGQWVVPSADDAAVRFPAFPLETSKAWLEMFHRYIATVLGATVVLLLWLGWPLRKTPGYPWRITLFLMFIVLVQGIFGALTVTLTLWPQVVTLHLLGGMGVLLLFVWLFCRLRILQRGGAQSPRRASASWWLVAGLLVGQLALGGWVSSNYAGMSCQGFPSCNGQWWPEMDLSEGFHLTQTVGPNYLHGQLHADARTAIQVAHRVWGGLLGVAILMLWWQHRDKTAARGLTNVLKIYCLQVTLGVASVIFWLPLWLALLHTAGAMALTVSFILAWWRWRYGPMADHSFRIRGGVLLPRFWALEALPDNVQAREAATPNANRRPQCD